MTAVLGVIPARYGATRFPGKPLAPILGRPLILWVVEAAGRAKTLDSLVVATDHPGVADVVRTAGGQALLTRADHRSGSDRAAEVASLEAFREHQVVVNIQGDEPLLDPDHIERAVQALSRSPEAGLTTLAAPLELAQGASPDVVKVSVDQDGWAVDFSRDQERLPGDALVYRHLGLYVFRREALLRFATEPSSRREREERLEQLRALETSLRIVVVPVERPPGPAVDRPEDIPRVEAILGRRSPDKGVAGSTTR